MDKEELINKYNKENLVEEDFSEFEDYCDNDELDDSDYSDDSILELELFPIIENFIKNHSLTSVIMGPVGSGKSVGCLIKLFFYMNLIRKSRDGIRRSRMVVVRNTQKELKDTTIRTFLQWFGRFGVFKATDMNFYLKINDVESEIQFLALDRPDDVKKLLSLECTCIYFNEVDKIERDIWEAAQSRIGRFPSLKANGTKAWFDKNQVKAFGMDNIDVNTKKPIQMECVWADTNPPMMGSYWHKLFEKQLFDEDTGTDLNPQDFKFFRQPGGMDSKAENKKYLPDNYYENMLKNQSPDKTDVRVHCKYGLSEAGLSIYRNSFKRMEHVKSDLHKKHYTKVHKLALGMDFGLNPCCVISQYIDGVLYVYKEVITRNINKRGLEEFLRTDLIPLIKREFPYHKLNGQDIVVFGDPAGNQRDQLKGRPLYQELKDKGFAVRLESIDNNRIAPRIEAVKTLLMQNPITKKEQVQIDGGKCSFLVDAFQGNYYYKKKKDGDFENEPEKNEYSHISDAFQYLCQHILKYKGRYLDRNDNYTHNEYKPVDNAIGY